VVAMEEAVIEVEVMAAVDATKPHVSLLRAFTFFDSVLG
jgi:hypothetical protein